MQRLQKVSWVARPWLPRLSWLALLWAAWSTVAAAQRLPVLRQIDLPHAYYYREMYLPQLTSGPSSLAWSPDSRELVYSMAGSLWRQALGTSVARQVTADGSYDYQPDWSSDGRWIVYVSYRNDAMELWVLDALSGARQALLQNGAVNVEPRFSPDGKRLVFVSTALNGHFHLFMGDFSGGKLQHVEALTGEHKSDLPRYYYSAIDHEISPLWSRDGRNIFYVSNRNHIYGTGGFWTMPAQAGAPAREIHYEETNWRARPDLAPDGSRLVFASYTGRQWHNLWVLPSGGGDPIAVGYDEADQLSPRWAPDGQHIAFVTNHGGNTSIGILQIPGGQIVPLPVGERRYLGAMGFIHIRVHDRNGQAVAARIAVTDAKGLTRAPPDAWIHADDGFDRHERPFEAHYFHAVAEATVTVPVGAAQVEVMQGFERPLQRRNVGVVAGKTTELDASVDDGRWTVPAEGRWVSGDVHVHMNYGGIYRSTPSHLLMQEQAEDLQVIEALLVNKEQRFPDIAFNARGLDPVSQPNALIVFSQEYHTSYWGHLGLLNLEGGIILPGYAGYPDTAASSLYPSNADVADLAHAKGALVGYVHPFDTPPHPLDPRERLTDELPVDVALGKVDYMEIVGFSDHRSTADVWYRLLNLGFRLPAAGGTDAMTNFASLRGPVGMNRVYVKVGPGGLTPAGFATALKQGRTFATNGPLLGLTLGGAEAGDELQLVRGSVSFRARLESIVPVDHLDLVCNGQVVRSLVRGKALAHGDFRGSLPVERSGWCLLRAFTDGARYPVLDNYAYATTSPIYVSLRGTKRKSPGDAGFFLAWLDRVTEATVAYPDWNNAEEKSHVMQQLQAARAVYERLR